MRFFANILVLLACLPALAANGNELPNGLFEHGLAGCILVRDDRSAPKEYAFEPAAAGNALRFSVEKAEMCGLYLPEYFFKAGKEYALSFKAKSSSPVTLGVAEYVLWDKRIPGVNGKFNAELTAQWQTFRFTYKTDQDRWSGFRLQNRAEATSTQTTIWISEIELSEVGTAAAPVPDLTAAVLAKNDVLRFSPGERLPLALDLMNRTAGDKTAQVNWTLHDPDAKKDVSSGSETLTLKPGHSQKELTLAAPRYHGVLRFQATISGHAFVNTLKLGIAPDVRKFRRALPVLLGVNGVVTPGNLQAPEVRELDYFTGAGISILRAWDSGTPFIWREIEPQEGVFNWKLADLLVENSKRADLDLLPVLGGMLFTYPDVKPFGTKEPAGHALPLWLYQKSQIKDSNAAWVKKLGRKIAYPPQEDWMRMVRTVVERYKSKVGMYEIMNEPNLCISAADYLPYLKNAHAIIRKTDPSAKIIGICATGDFNAGIISYVNVALELKAGEYCDAVSFHPYNNIFEDSPSPGDVVFAAMREALKRNQCPDMPLWNTELYFLSPKTKSGSDYVNGLVYHPGYLVRRYLLDAAYGVRVSALVQGQTFAENEINDHCNNNRSVALFRNRLIPSRNYIVTAVFADLLHDTTFSFSENREPGVRAYHFSGDKKHVAALFALNAPADEEGGVRLDWSELPAGVRLVDVFGNPLPEQNGTREARLSAIPMYLCGTNRDEVVAALNKIKLSRL